ncbi:neprilysin-11-like isoform X2 [Tigriopus californicus]|uniref:neprilysin-11-like isoform X2 n=1 Tax=Tigriopus californicus TaxID=6832 RepID=UPI0027D9D3AE|nr:neprilysin-11-like isoform X2 [Tigriopus californicus]
MGALGTVLLLLCHLAAIFGLQTHVKNSYHGTWGPNSIKRASTEPIKSDIPEYWKTMDYSKIMAREATVDSTRSAAGPETVPGNTNDVCMTKGCVQSAAILLSNMDESVKPCDDFYHFMCGNYIKNTVIPQSSHSMSYFESEKQKVHHQIHSLLIMPVESPSKSDKDVRNFFHSCMDEAAQEQRGLEPVIEMLVHLDLAIPMMNAAPSKDSLNINHVLKQLLFNLMADTSLFGLDVAQDMKDAKNKQILSIYPPKFDLPGYILVNNSKQSAAVRSFYRDYLLQIAKQYRNHLALTRYQGTADMELEIAIKRIVDIQEALIKIMTSKPTLLDQLKEVTFQEFKAALKPQADEGLDIAGVIEHVVKNLTGVVLTPSTKVNVPDWKYFQRLSSVIAQVSYTDMVNLLVFQKMVEFAPYTTRSMYQLRNIFYGSITGLEVPPPRWDTCVQTTVSYFGAKVSQMLIKNEHGAEIKNLTLSMVANLKEAFKELINEAKWMDAETSAKAQEKLSSMDTLVVFLDSIQGKVIEHVYEGMPPMKAGTLLANTVNLQIFWTRKALSTLKEKPTFENTDDKSFDTGLVNAMYVPNFNAIWIPLGILHSPMFQKDRLSASNFGALGMVLGHEMTHGFDNMGSLFDKSGNWKAT